MTNLLHPHVGPHDLVPKVLRCEYFQWKENGENLVSTVLFFSQGFFFSQKSYHFNQLRKLELETNSKNLRNVGHRADKTVVIAEKIFVESLG